MAPSDRSGRSRLFAVVVAAWLLLGAVAGLPAAAATEAGAGQLEDDDGGLLNETVDSTTDTVDSTVDGTTDTVDATTDTVEETTESTTETVDSTLDGTTETVDGATGGTTDDTTDAITVATDGVTDATDTTADGVTDVTDTTTDEVDTAVWDTTSATDAVTDDTTDGVTAAAEGDLAGAAGSLGDATDETTTLTTDRVTSLAETTGAVTTDLTETTSEVTADLSDGTTGALAELGGSSGTSTLGATAGDAVENVAGSSLDEISSGERDDAVSSERAASLESGSSDGVNGADGATDGTGDGTGGATTGERSLAPGPDGPLTTLGGVPVSEDAATGFGLGALLVGAAGVAVRQASAAGGTGAGTTAVRAASMGVAPGEGPLSRLARMLSVFRYSRYDDSDPLELDARRHVYEAISDQPGDPITAVSDRADVNLSTARHHVKVLQNEGLIATARVRNCERFYPAGTEDLELAAAMADECTADILDALVRLEPASVSGLADEVDRSPSTVTHHLQKLEDDDIVVRERAGRSVENKLSAPARAALDPETERRQHAAERRLEAEADRSDAASGASAD